MSFICYIIFHSLLQYSFILAILGAGEGRGVLMFLWGLMMLGCYCLSAKDELNRRIERLPRPGSLFLHRSSPRAGRFWLLAGVGLGDGEVVAEGARVGSRQEAWTLSSILHTRGETWPWVGPTLPVCNGCAAKRCHCTRAVCARVSVSHGVSTDSSASNNGELCPLTPAILGSRVGLFLRTPQKGAVVSFEAISHPCCRLGLALSCLQMILRVFLGLHIYGYFRLAGGSLTLFGCTSLYVFTVLEWDFRKERNRHTCSFCHLELRGRRDRPASVCIKHLLPPFMRASYPIRYLPRHWLPRFPILCMSDRLSFSLENMIQWILSAHVAFPSVTLFSLDQFPETGLLSQRRSLFLWL